jgi:hypothetical protein
VGCVRLEGRRDVPGVGASVCDAVYDGFDRDDVGGWAAKEEESDIAWRVMVSEKG